MQHGINAELLQNSSNACSSLKLTNKPYMRPAEETSAGKRSSRQQFWLFLTLIEKPSFVWFSHAPFLVPLTAERG
jgi:hypothetical protein